MVKNRREFININILNLNIQNTLSHFFQHSLLILNIEYPEHTVLISTQPFDFQYYLNLKRIVFEKFKFVRNILFKFICRDAFI